MDWDTVDLDTKLFIYYNITHPRKYDLVDVSRFLTCEAGDDCMVRATAILILIGQDR